MKSIYRTIVGVSGYEYGIYRGGKAKLQSNGRRMRLIWDAVRWEGNTGGHHTYTQYLTQADGRRLLRHIRQHQIMDLKGRYDGSTVLSLLCGWDGYYAR